jgi:hypothetical protein
VSDCALGSNLALTTLVVANGFEHQNELFSARKQRVYYHYASPSKFAKNSVWEIDPSRHQKSKLAWFGAAIAKPITQKLAARSAPRRMEK